MSKHSIYQPTFPQKYTGDYPIKLKSSWELEFASRNCDLNPSCLQWAYEPHDIPYRDPLTGRQKVYRPDFLLTFLTTRKAVKTVIVEIKPMKEAIEEYARSRADAAIQIRNFAKWQAAKAWCARRGWEFQLITEDQMWLGKRRPPKRRIRRAQ